MCSGWNPAVENDFGTDRPLQRIHRIHRWTASTAGPLDRIHRWQRIHARGGRAANSSENLREPCVRAWYGSLLGSADMATKLARRKPRTTSTKHRSRSTSSPVRIEGIVSDEALAQPGRWYVMFLMPWRHPDGRTIDEPLRVAPDVPRSVARTAERSYRCGVAVRVTAKQVTKGRGFTYWNADGISKVEKLRKLQLAQPEDISVKHALGRLVLDRRYGEFVGKRGRAVLAIDRIDGLLAAATTRVRAVEEKQPQIRAAIAKSLVPVYNKHWRETRPLINAAAFDRRLKLSTIHVGDGRTTLYYSCGSLFADHGVEVRIGARGAISEILIS